MNATGSMPAFAGSVEADAPAIRITAVARIERRDKGDTLETMPPRVLNMASSFSQSRQDGSLPTREPYASTVSPRCWAAGFWYCPCRLRILCIVHADTRADGREHRGASGAPQHALDASQQLARLERLGDVVISTGLQPDYAVDRVRGGGHHDDTDPSAFLAQPARQRKPVLARQADVEQHQRWQFVLDQAAQRYTAVDPARAKILPHEVVDEQLALGRLVFDHDNLRPLIHCLRSGYCRRLIGNSTLRRGDRNVQPPVGASATGRARYPSTKPSSGSSPIPRDLERDPIRPKHNRH